MFGSVSLAPRDYPVNHQTRLENHIDPSRPDLIARTMVHTQCQGCYQQPAWSLRAKYRKQP